MTVLRYPNASNRQAAASLRALGFHANDVLKPRTVADTWGGDRLKYHRLMLWGFQFAPTAVGDWIADFAEACRMAAIERAESPDAGYRPAR